jgi:hypothetical protein
MSRWSETLGRVPEWIGACQSSDLIESFQMYHDLGRSLPFPRCSVTRGWRSRRIWAYHAIVKRWLDLREMVVVLCLLRH